MKNKDLKKGKESIIGKIIYGFLLFMPLLAILSTILVNTFNQKANETTETTIVEVPTYYETNEVNTLDDLIVGNSYTLNADQNTTTRVTFFGELLGIKYSTLIQYGTITSTIETPYFYGIDDSIVRYINTNYDIEYIHNGIVDFVYNGTFSDITPLLPYISECTQQYQKGTTQEEQITYVQNDIFYYAVDKVENSNLFNWAENSLIYTGIANTCTQLSITTTFIPLLLTYWLIISVIYILYDIVLMILIILHNKIHRLQDSI